MTSLVVKLLYLWDPLTIFFSASKFVVFLPSSPSPLLTFLSIFLEIFPSPVAHFTLLICSMDPLVRYMEYMFYSPSFLSNESDIFR